MEKMIDFDQMVNFLMANGKLSRQQAVAKLKSEQAAGKIAIRDLVIENRVVRVVQPMTKKLAAAQKAAESAPQPWLKAVAAAGGIEACFGEGSLEKARKAILGNVKCDLFA